MDCIRKGILLFHSISSRYRKASPDCQNIKNACFDSESRERTSTSHYFCPEISCWTKEQEKIIASPYEYIASQSGKDFRRKFLEALNQCLKVDNESFEIIYRTISILHNSSLLIDDIQDGASLRRGQKVAHDVFGVAQSINSANYMYFVAMQEASKLRSWPASMVIFNEELMELHRGQGIELFWTDSGVVPSEAEYLLMVSYKAGGLFTLASRLMQSVSEEKADLTAVAHAFGLIFQIRDDYLNLCSDQHSSAKGFCEDISEGKFSFPLIHAIHSEIGPSKIREILLLRTKNVEAKNWVVSFLKEATNSFEYTEEYLQRLSVWARTLIPSIGKGGQKFEEIFEYLQVSH